MSRKRVNRTIQELEHVLFRADLLGRVGTINQSEGSSLAFDLGSSDDLTRKNHGGRYGSFNFDAVTAELYHGHDALWNIM